MNHTLINECIHYKGRDFHVIHIIKNSVASINEDYVYFDSLLLAYREEAISILDGKNADGSTFMELPF